MKEKVNQMLKDKLFLVMLVLGLLTMVAAAGIMTVQKGKNSANDPMLHMAEEENTPTEEALQMAGAVTPEKKHRKKTGKKRLEPTQGKIPMKGMICLQRRKNRMGQQRQEPERKRLMHWP